MAELARDHRQRDASRDRLSCEGVPQGVDPDGALDPGRLTGFIDYDDRNTNLATGRLYHVFCDGAGTAAVSPLAWTCTRMLLTPRRLSTARIKSYGNQNRFRRTGHRRGW